MGTLRNGDGVSYILKEIVCVSWGKMPVQILLPHSSHLVTEWEKTV